MLMSSFKSKISNFWYYYKYYLLVAVLAVFATVIAVKSCADRQNYDLCVMFATHSVEELGVDEDGLPIVFDTDDISLFLNEYVTDNNGDKTPSTQIISIFYGKTANDYSNASAIRAANISSGKCALYLLDKQNYNELHQNGFLYDLTELGESKYIEGDRFNILESGLLDSVEVFKAIQELETETPYYLCIRAYNENQAEKNSTYKKQHEAAIDTMKNIIKSAS